MIITPSKLRADVYNILDKVLKTGIPVEIIRNGKKLKIVSEEKIDKLKNLKKRPGLINCDPEELVHIDWSHLWQWKDYE